MLSRRFIRSCHRSYRTTTVPHRIIKTIATDAPLHYLSFFKCATAQCNGFLGGFKVMPYSTGCKTPLYNFEANSNYKEVPDPKIMVTFLVVDDEDGAAFVAWKTTPWILPRNLALCVNSNFVYVKVKSISIGKIYVVAESRLSELPVEKAKKGKPNGVVYDKTKGSSSNCGKAKNFMVAYEVLDKFQGSSLSGTGIVHCPPAFGEDDYRVCLENQIIHKGENLVMVVNDDGCFTERVIDFIGRYVKEADKDIIQADKSRLVKSGSFTHSYPFCWRSDTLLIYRAVPSWFLLHCMSKAFPEMPIFGLVDWNPAGLAILCTFNYGSIGMGLEAYKYACNNQVVVEIKER
ncbi:unnamed protein product [Lactuca saligna]|uniref:Isoleucyl-tRNA synthetase n=1 Tax=Lactuca saligna TaxID=75948 RepID=A0AA36EG43_LACSI|nr:unnamed protein product [Lactuca saligna]